MSFAMGWSSHPVGQCPSSEGVSRATVSADVQAAAGPPVLTSVQQRPVALGGRHMEPAKKGIRGCRKVARVALPPPRLAINTPSETCQAVRSLSQRSSEQAGNKRALRVASVSDDDADLPRTPQKPLPRVREPPEMTPEALPPHKQAWAIISDEEMDVIGTGCDQ